ncbi:importin 5, putative [Ichthyophthirius multifiliis]|uniref:Importin 5, putative n=1 Tax=Ichthyophthirius multifiliis TaxID=5932 RepID=G0QYI4_ICHMU|nr:importin 5, putative [Ichthyophthirius multifiliis]EGR29723.1 importin 5, putative [Ichthyophthirius multifiliis]|eukprot:XP_004030959.1 importin 5, putative [Ichthyophthirius multifiliis]
MAEQIQKIIQNLVGNIQNAEIQKQAENSLKQISQQDPNSFVINLLTLLKHSENKDIRTFIASHLRKITSKFSEQSFTCIWESLTPETQSAIKQILFELIKIEQTSSIRNLISSCIGELGSSLLEDTQNNQWPELLPQVWQLFSQESIHLQESAFKILSNLLTFASENFEKNQNELKVLFQNGLNNSNTQIKVSCIEAIGAYICVLEPKEQKNYQFLLPLIFQSLYQVTQTSQDDGIKILEVLNDIAETEPKYFNENFEDLFSVVWKLNMEEKEKTEKDLKEIGTETITTIITRIPKLIRQNPQYIQKLLELVYSHMVDIEKEIESDWLSPKEGFSEEIEEDSDFESVRFGMNTIDKIIESVGDKETLPALWAIIGKLLETQNDWRYIYAAIMSLSQVGQYVEEDTVLKSVIDKILVFLQHQNPMIRYSVLHTISQISEDAKPTLQELYKSNLTQILVQQLNDSVPRVVSQASEALATYLEGLKSEDIDQTQIEKILQDLFLLINKGISIVKEKAVFALGSLIELSKDKFLNYFDQCMISLFDIFSQYTQKEYRQLRGNTIECITLASQAVPKENFSKYLEKIVQTIIYLQDQQIDSQNKIDPLKSYVLTGWQRLSLNYSSQLVSYLPNIIPGIYKLVEQIVIKKTEDEVEIYNSDDAELALGMLEVFIQEFGSNFSSYVEQTTKLITPLCTYRYSENIRDTASKCLPGLVKCAEKEPHIQQNIVRYFIGILWDAANKEYDSEVMIAQINAMKSCIENTGDFMTSEELVNLSQKTVKLLLDSDKRKAESEKWKTEQEVDDDEKEIYEEEVHLEEDLQVQIAELIGVLFKTHKQKTLPFAQDLYSEVLPKVIDTKVSDKMHKFGIFLIDDMVEFLGFEFLGEQKWDEFLKALSHFVLDKNIQVRQAAAYGLGIFSINTPVQIFPKYSSVILKALSDSAQIAQGKEKDKNFGHCRDNIISSIGKVLRYQFDSVNVGELLPFWVKNLPLKKINRKLFSIINFQASWC